ncbi:MAG: translation initiation factor eIF-2B [Anaerolineales bacterium]|nr:translation initiation factor eIF-2B [Anaerolineales bacterium]
MSEHPAIVVVVERVRNDEVGGAADSAKEVMEALSKLAQDSQAEDTESLVAEVDDAVLDIMRVMPSLAPPINALHQFVGSMERGEAEGATVKEMKEILQKTADDFCEWAENALVKVAQYGAEKVSDGDRVFMYSMSSTVWRILQTAKAQGKSFEVIVTESRPANEGLWTVTEMDKLDIPVSVSIDACVGELIPDCDVVFVGADVISSSGHSLCKVGTYPSALVAKASGTPFYIAADTLKFDPGTLIGLPYRNEAIHRDEVLDESYPERAKVVGHLFDETPPELVTAIITEMGILHPAAAFTVLQQMNPSEKLSAMLPAWSRGEL